MRERVQDGWTIRDVLATEEGATALELMIDFQCQSLMDQMAADTEPATRLKVLREGKAVRQAMLAEMERVL